VWYETPRVQTWRKENPTVEKWLDRLTTAETRNVFGQALEVFTIWSGKTPQELLDMRREDLKNPDDGFRTLELAEQFIMKGEYPDRRKGREGKTVKVAESCRARRELYLTAIRSFFAHSRLELPRDKTFRIAKSDNVPETETFMDLETARKIIACLKEPYRSLATAALYGGLGRKEALSLNRMWPTIQKQLAEEKDPVRLDFAGRKNNPDSYFTFLPAKILKPHLGKEIPFGVYTKHSKTKRLRPMNESDLLVAWRFAKKRAGVQDKQTFHMLRDLLVTSFYRVGADVTTAQFLTGHGVDSNRYLQIKKAPERAEVEWIKYRQFLDSGVTGETTQQIQQQTQKLESQAEEIKKLREQLNQVIERQEKLMGVSPDTTRDPEQRVRLLEDLRAPDAKRRRRAQAIAWTHATEEQLEAEGLRKKKKAK
jgi:hypothetical protein